MAGWIGNRRTVKKRLSQALAIRGAQNGRPAPGLDRAWRGKLWRYGWVCRVRAKQHEDIECAEAAESRGARKVAQGAGVVSGGARSAKGRIRFQGGGRGS